MCCPRKGRKLIVLLQGTALFLDVVGREQQWGLSLINWEILLCKESGYPSPSLSRVNGLFCYPFRKVWSYKTLSPRWLKADNSDRILSAGSKYLHNLLLSQYLWVICPSYTTLYQWKYISVSILENMCCLNFCGNQNYSLTTKGPLQNRKLSVTSICLKCLDSLNVTNKMNKNWKQIFDIWTGKEIISKRWKN